MIKTTVHFQKCVDFKIHEESAKQMQLSCFFFFFIERKQNIFIQKSKSPLNYFLKMFFFSVCFEKKNLIENEWDQVDCDERTVSIWMSIAQCE